MQQGQQGMGIGFEPMMDENENLFVAIHVRLGMLASSYTIPEAMVPEFIDSIRNTLADGKQERKKVQQERKTQGLLGPSGLPITVPTIDVLNRLSKQESDELRAKVIEASQQGQE